MTKPEVFKPEILKKLEINENVKPSNKTKILNFDDEELEKEEEKLPNFGIKPNMNPEINKFSFMKRPINSPKNAGKEEEEEDSDEEKPIILHIEKDSHRFSRENDKEIEFLDKILDLEKNLGKKNEQIGELMKKVEELQKKNEEFKQMAYKSNKDMSQTSRTLQIDYEKLKIALHESEEKRQAILEENRQMSNKQKKLELDYKNVEFYFNFYEFSSIFFNFFNLLP